MVGGVLSIVPVAGLYFLSNVKSRSASAYKVDSFMHRHYREALLGKGRRRREQAGLHNCAPTPEPADTDRSGSSDTCLQYFPDPTPCLTRLASSHAMLPERACHETSALVVLCCGPCIPHAYMLVSTSAVCIAMGGGGGPVTVVA